MEQTALFQILSDETRLRALSLMYSAGEVCVCELVHALELSQPKISRHMAAIRDAGIAKSRRDAQWVFYALSTNLPDWQQTVLDASMKSLEQNATTKADHARLITMPNRPERIAA